MKGSALNKMKKHINAIFVKGAFFLNSFECIGYACG